MQLCILSSGQASCKDHAASQHCIQRIWLYLAADVPEEPPARASHSAEFSCGAGGKGLANTCPDILAAYCCSSVCSLACQRTQRAVILGETQLTGSGTVEGHRGSCREAAARMHASESARQGRPLLADTMAIQYYGMYYADGACTLELSCSGMAGLVRWRAR